MIFLKVPAKRALSSTAILARTKSSGYVPKVAIAPAPAPAIIRQIGSFQSNSLSDGSNLRMLPYVMHTIPPKGKMRAQHTEFPDQRERHPPYLIRL